jgi:phospholipid-translocating ATPase
MFEDEHLLKGSRCGSARLLTMFVVVLLNQINYNQLPPAQPAFSPVEDSVPARTLSNVLWSNTVLAVGSAVGFVIYTGSETHAVMNMGMKVGLLDLEINRLAKVSLFLNHY